MSAWRSLVARWRGWREERSRWRAADRLLDELFMRRQELLQPTSLRPEHRGRCRVLDTSGLPRRFGFGIVRHPRPHPHSRQFHEVLELWIYHVVEGRLERVRGVNLSKTDRASASSSR